MNTEKPLDRYVHKLDLECHSLKCRITTFAESLRRFREGTIFGDHDYNERKVGYFFALLQDEYANVHHQFYKLEDALNDLKKDNQHGSDLADKRD